jgi:hypothetical protein
MIAPQPLPSIEFPGLLVWREGRAIGWLTMGRDRTSADWGRAIVELKAFPSAAIAKPIKFQLVKASLVVAEVAALLRSINPYKRQ